MTAKATWFKRPRVEQDLPESPTKRRKTGHQPGKPAGPEGPSDTPDTVMFVPKTRGGVLVNLLKAKERELKPYMNSKVRIEEEAGTKLVHILTKADPFRGPCGRIKCTICPRNQKMAGKCYSRNVTYTSTCMICKARGVVSKYVGETSRSLLERDLEHHADALGKKANSHRRTHLETTHPEMSGQDPNNLFQVEIVKSHRSSFQRLVHEALEIRRGGSSLLNSKEEYCRNLLPNLQMEEVRNQTNKMKGEMVPTIAPWYMDKEVDKIDRKNRQPEALGNHPKRMKITSSRARNDDKKDDVDDDEARDEPQNDDAGQAKEGQDKIHDGDHHGDAGPTGQTGDGVGVLGLHQRGDDKEKCGEEGQDEGQVFDIDVEGAEVRPLGHHHDGDDKEKGEEQVPEVVVDGEQEHHDSPTGQAEEGQDKLQDGDHHGDAGPTDQVGDEVGVLGLHHEDQDVGQVWSVDVDGDGDDKDKGEGQVPEVGVDGEQEHHDSPTGPAEGGQDKLQDGDHHGDAGPTGQVGDEVGVLGLHHEDQDVGQVCSVVVDGAEPDHHGDEGPAGQVRCEVGALGLHHDEDDKVKGDEQDQVEMRTEVGDHQVEEAGPTGQSEGGDQQDEVGPTDRVKSVGHIDDEVTHEDDDDDRKDGQTGSNITVNGNVRSGQKSIMDILRQPKRFQNNRISKSSKKRSKAEVAKLNNPSQLSIQEFCRKQEGKFRSGGGGGGISKHQYSNLINYAFS